VKELSEGKELAKSVIEIKERNIYMRYQGRIKRYSVKPDVSGSPRKNRGEQ
jgi:hypothetical protein